MEEREGEGGEEGEGGSEGDDGFEEGGEDWKRGREGGRRTHSSADKISNTWPE